VFIIIDLSGLLLFAATRKITVSEVIEDCYSLYWITKVGRTGAKSQRVSIAKSGRFRFFHYSCNRISDFGLQSHL
jgi:hypothetical protein